MKAGDKVVVIQAADDTLFSMLPQRRKIVLEDGYEIEYLEDDDPIGLRGVVIMKLPYQEIGDNPDKDPMWLVDLGPHGRHPFWTEELEFQRH